MKLSIEKEKLSKPEKIIPIIIVIFLGLIVHGYYKNGFLELTASKLLALLSIVLFLQFFFQGLSISPYRLRINRLYNFTIWLFISVLLVGINYLFSYHSEIHGFDCKDLPKRLLHFPLTYFLYYQFMRIIHILYFNKEPILATRYLRDFFEEKIGRKISTGEFEFTTIYLFLGFVILIILFEI
ncbi:MAG: hypothetical protein DRJ05_11640 [Bacteroidetes bacterium]|nr:MAG: hypothetical protein DRJ05_11640 [Bacteroidota bacterium]